MQHYFN